MKIWEDFVKTQESELSHEACVKWLKSLRVVHFDARNLYLEADDPFAIHWFEEHVRPKVRKHLVNNNSAPIKVHLSQKDALAPPKKQKAIWKPVLDLSPDSLDPNSTFDHFIPGESNALTIQLFLNILDKKEHFNPVFISGPSGSGKTHLLMAACHHLIAKGLSCFYVRAETFTEHLIAAIRNGATRLFRDLYRNHDVLLVDDIDTIAGRSATQEEFFHMFNALHTAGKQMIFAAHNIPSAFTNIEPRLTSRFEWGIVLSLQKLQTHYLKEFPSTNASILLEKLLIEERKSILTPEKIIRSVCEVCGTTTQDILGKSQKQECVIPRQIAIYLCRTHLKMPFEKIGQIFSRDHSTIMTSVKIVQKKLDQEDKETSHSLKEISEKIG